MCTLTWMEDFDNEGTRVPCPISIPLVLNTVAGARREIVVSCAMHLIYQCMWYEGLASS